MFIIASGTSLSNIDLEPLNRRLTIGLNRSFMAFPNSYYHCVFDHRLYEMYPEELKTASHIKLPMEAWRDHKKLTKFLGDVEKTMNK